MSNYYKPKEFSALTSVTTRTLHYYDEIGLLNPSHKTMSGHRLYSDEDILKLQQITTLKYFGFPLDEISQLIKNPNFNIKKSLRTQAKLLAEELMQTEKAAKLQQSLVNALDENIPVDLQTITESIEVLNMREEIKQSWYDKYLTQSEIQEYEQLVKKYPDQYWEDYSRRWAGLFKDIEANLNSNPQSELAKKFVRRWFTLVDEVYGDYPHPWPKNLGRIQNRSYTSQSLYL
jgi:DNA-binding transcriptional MerR regulator